MRAVYGCLVFGLFLTPVMVRPDPERLKTDPPPAPQPPEVRKERSDPRAVRLQHFLRKMGSPAAPLAPVFVREADENHLDWRLLPGISVVESGAGKVCRNNNIFGWKNGEEQFPSLAAGIHEVARSLGRSRLYRDRDLIGKLRLYNSEDEAYVEKVLTVMNQIGGPNASAMTPIQTAN